MDNIKMQPGNIKNNLYFESLDDSDQNLVSKIISN